MSKGTSPEWKAFCEIAGVFLFVFGVFAFLGFPFLVMEAFDWAGYPRVGEWLGCLIWICVPGWLLWLAAVDKHRKQATQKDAMDP